MLYEVAIQTGLSSGECRSLTRGRMFLDGDKPFVTCKAGSTKNKKLARQYIQAELADRLTTHLATKAPQAAVFAMPHETNVAKMLREDLADARQRWLKATKDPAERIRREQSDFLADVNHEGEVFDFHCLRHTTGAWLALANVHPKVVQTVMRHSSITLTMDTYGHLFPGQESDAVQQMRGVMTDATEALQATGTDGQATAESGGGAQRLAQRSRREPTQSPATCFDGSDASPEEDDSRKALRIVAIRDAERSVSRECKSRPGGIRTPDQGSMSPLL